MKMNPADFKILKEAIEPLITKEVIDQYETGQFHNSKKVKDLNTRFRWTCFMWPAIHLLMIFMANMTILI